MATPVLPGTPVVCKPGQKTSIVNQGRKKVHMILTDGTEMVDEYDGLAPLPAPVHSCAHSFGNCDRMPRGGPRSVEPQGDLDPGPGTFQECPHEHELPLVCVYGALQQI